MPGFCSACFGEMVRPKFLASLKCHRPIECGIRGWYFFRPFLRTPIVCTQASNFSIAPQSPRSRPFKASGGRCPQHGIPHGAQALFAPGGEQKWWIWLVGGLVSYVVEILIPKLRAVWAVPFHEMAIRTSPGVSRSCRRAFSSQYSITSLTYTPDREVCKSQGSPTRRIEEGGEERRAEGARRVPSLGSAERRFARDARILPSRWCP